MIPKIIHYCWFGKKKKNEQIQKCLASWRRIMPDYQIKEWNESNTSLAAPYLQTAYKHQLWSKIANFVRLYVLYKEGGIYLDTDIEVIRSLDDLRHHACFLGFQLEEKGSDWVNNAVLGARPGHSFLSECLNATLAYYNRTQSFARSPEITTTVLIKRGLQTYGLQTIDDITLYPIDYFYPYHWDDQFEPECLTDNTYCIHHWQLSWLDKIKRFQKRPLPVASPPEDKIQFGSQEIEIVAVRLLDNKGQELESLIGGQPLQIQLLYRANAPVPWPIFSVSISRPDGLVCFDTNTGTIPPQPELKSGEGQITLQIDRLDLNSGRYFVDTGIYEHNWAYTYDYRWHYDSLYITAIEETGGILAPPRRWLPTSPDNTEPPLKWFGHNHILK